MSKLSQKTSGIINYSDYKKTRFKILYVVLIFFLFVAVLTALIPVLWLFISSFKEASELTSVPYRLLPEHFDLGKVAQVWKMLDFGKYYLNTLIVVVGAVVCSVVFNGILAYVFAIVKPYGSGFFFGLVLLSYMIPTVASIVPIFASLVKLKLMNTYVPLWLIFGANSFYLIMFKNYFESLPKALFEAAQMDKCGKFKAFFKVVVPLSWPIIGVVSIFTMTAAWSDFLLPYLILDDSAMQTVMVRIYNIQDTMSTSMGFTQDKLLMLLSLSILPQIVLFAFFQKKITASVTMSGIKE